MNLLDSFVDFRAAASHGAYAWMVLSFPSATGIESLWARDVRRGQLSVDALPRRVAFS